MTFPSISRERLGLLLGFIGMVICGGTLPPQILLFAAGVVATAAISTRTRGRKAPDRPELTSVPGVTPPATPT